MTETDRTCIILAENDVLIRNLIGTILSNAGHCVLAAANDTEALELSRSFSGEVRLLIARSAALADSLTHERPGIHIILLSATDSSALKEIVRRVEPGAFLQQAALPAALSESIKRALETSDLDGGLA